jgi:TRAP-type C4-dicarboxylate transport system substrate-binding protein
MKRLTRFKYGQQAIILFCAVCFLAISPISQAADLSEKQIRTTVEESMKAILTGQAYTPTLERNQLILRAMFEKGAITKADLETMAKNAIFPIMETCTTSRYILKKAPERVDALLSPYMSWEEIHKIVWEVGTGMVPDGEQVVLTIGTLAPPGTPWMSIPENVLIPRMAKLSNNKFIVKIYGGGIMGEDTDILRKMDIGQLDGCGCTALGILAASPEAAVFLLPGLYKNYDEIDYITEKFRKRIDQSYEKRGYILAALIDTGFFYIFSRNRVDNLADLKKLNFSTWVGEIETTMFEELGINGTPVAVPETISAFSTGMINANMSPAAWMLGMQAYQYVNFYVKEPILYSPAAVVISVKTKERIKKRFGVSETFAINVQEMLIYEVSTLEEEWRALSRNYEKKCLEAFETKCGIKVVNFSAADRRKMEQAFLNVQEKLADKIFPSKLMVEIKEALAEYRSKK